MALPVEKLTDEILDLACLGSDHDRPARRALAAKMFDENSELGTQNIFTLALCGNHQVMLDEGTEPDVENRITRTAPFRSRA